MPYTARRARSGKGYDIVNKKTGKKVGHSTTKSNATKSARVRNAVHHGWRPTGRRRSR